MLQIFFCLLAVLLHLAAQPSLLVSAPLTVEAPVGQLPLGPSLQVWQDSSGQASFEEAQEQFQQGAFAKSEVSTFRYDWTPQVSWWYLELDFQRSGDWVLLLDYPLIHGIQFFVATQGEAFQQTFAGNRIDASERPFHYRLNGLPLNSTAPERQRIFIRVETQGQAAIAPYLVDLNTLRQGEQSELLLFGAFFGFIFITVIYRLGLAVGGTHQRSSVLYSLLVLAQGWIYWLYSGLALQFDLAGSPEMFRYSLYLSVPLAGASLIGFVGYFLRVSTWSHEITRLLQGLLMLLGLLIVGNLLLENRFARLVFPLLTLTYLVVQAVALYAFYRKRPFALATFLTFLGPAIGAVVATLGVEGVLPNNFFVFYAHLFGLLAEIIILNLLQARRTQWLALSALERKQQLLDAERRLSEQLQESNTFKTQLIQRASHELQTPLNGILGLLEALQEEVRKQAPALLERLQLIRNNGWRMARLIAELLDQQLLNEGRVNLQLQPVDLGTLVRETVPLLQEPLSPNVSFTQELPPGLPLVHADPERLQQIFLNLLNNAIRYTDSGSVVLRVQALDPETLEVVVEDTGTGISPADQARIFEPMQRGQAARGEGMGVGLSITRELVEAHGGTLKLQSTVGEGTCFQLTLQVRPSGLMEAEPLPAPEPSGTSPLRSLNPTSVLVVDDEWMNLRVVQELLESEGVELHLAQSGPAALEFLEGARSQNKLPALVLLDVRMPGMDGLEVCERIRQQFTRDELPVLLMTALRGLQDFEEGWEAGANDYLTKPLNRTELLARLHNWLYRTSGDAQTEAAASEEPPPPSPNRDQELRLLAVELMNRALKVWEATMKVGAIDLAQQSGIWGCYQDAQTGAWRIRSLKNYLDLDSLPNNPRWGRITRTIQYVAERCRPAPEAAELASGLDQLTRLLQQLGRKY